MNQDSTQAPNPNVIWIIWAALAMSVLIYGTVGVVLKMNGSPQAVDPKLIQTLSLAFGAVVLMETVLAVIVLGRVLARSGNFFTYCIIRWALMETSAIFGLVLLLLGAGLEIAAGFMAWSLLWILLLAPTASAKEKFEELSQLG